MKKLLVSACVVLSLALSAAADSPVTSTVFHKAYLDEPFIALAQSAEGVLIPELQAYLISDAPLELKMAVINTLSWDIDGKTNAVLFWQFLQQEKGYQSKLAFLRTGHADELLSMAYLLAMDDYFNVDTAIIFADAALEKNTSSYTANIIAAIIRAQEAMAHDWCAVYRLTNSVRENSSLEIDMRPEARTIIFEYMDLYREFCD